MSDTSDQSPKGESIALSGLAESPPSNAWIIVEAGDLKKGDNLRKAAETSPAAIAIPCYADDAKSLNLLIDEELAAAGLRITADARMALQDCLGVDPVRVVHEEHVGD